MARSTVPGVNDLITVATFLHRGEAEISQARLAAAGIDAIVQADDEGGLNPGFFDEYRVRLVVRSGDADAALETLSDSGSPD